MDVQLSIVVPVYRSADCLPELVHRIEHELNDARIESYELILVNDASPDESWKIIQELSRKFRFVTGLNLRKNVGQDNAIMAGLSRAKGDVVVVMDDDLQHDPADIPRLYERSQGGFDVVYAHFEQKEQAFWKNLGSDLADRIAVWLLGKPKGLYMSPFKAIRRDVVREILRYGGPFSYVDGIILSLTSNFSQVPATHHPRFSGSSNYSFVRSLRVAAKLATGFSVVPLRIASLAGAGIAVLSFVAGAYYLIERLVSDYDVEGWATLIVAVAFLGGIQLIGIGTLGEYLGRLYLTVNQRPQYSISQVCGGSEGPESRDAPRADRPFPSDG